MSKLVMIAVIIVIVYFLFFRKMDGAKPKQKPKQEKDNKQSEAMTDTMVECVKCNTFLSIEDTVLKAGKHFCSKECANQ